MKRFAACAAALFATAVLACPAQAEDTIKIGVPGAHTGALASYGVPSLNAAKLVAEKVNASGGVLGKKIQLLTEDDQCKAELAANAATKLISEDANVVCCHFTRTFIPSSEQKKHENPPKTGVSSMLF